jgi:basic amino acid/polyamine antiporter, APA family
MATSSVPEHTRLFRRLPIEQIEDETSRGGLRRTLGLWQLTAIGIGGIIGAGIFALAGKVANDPVHPAGPSVLVSFLIAGIASAAAALSYAEFSGLIPRAGSGLHLRIRGSR